MALIEQLQRRKDFTKADEALADYILAHAREVAHMNIADVARGSFTSPAAVNRLCHRVGCDGFRQFKIELLADLQHLRDEMDVNPNLELRRGESTTQIITDISSVYRKAVKMCESSLDALELSNAAQAVRMSQRVVLFAGGDSAASCELFANNLQRIGISTVAAYRYGDGWSAARMGHAGDVAIVVSYSGVQLDLIAAHLRMMRERGCHTVVVTSRGLGAGRLSGHDAVLSLPMGESVMSSTGTFFSQACIGYVLSCLYAAVFSLDAERHAAHKEAVDAPNWS